MDVVALLKMQTSLKVAGPVGQPCFVTGSHPPVTFSTFMKSPRKVPLVYWQGYFQIGNVCGSYLKR